MASECDHGAVPGACHLCRGDRPEPAAGWSRPFAAKWPGTCSGCGFDVVEGQVVQWRLDTLQVRHVGCGHG